MELNNKNWKFEPVDRLQILGALQDEVGNDAQARGTINFISTAVSTTPKNITNQLLLSWKMRIQFYRAISLKAEKK